MTQVAESLRRGPARRRHVSVDAHHLAGAGHRNQDGQLAADGVHLRIDHAFHQGGGAGGVNCIAALPQNFDSGQGGAVMLGGNRTAPAEHAGIEGRLLGGLGSESAGAALRRDDGHGVPGL
jgi:hypothetical protein